MAISTLETDPERSYEHARAAANRAGRIGVAREFAALAAYQTGRYAEALRELRAYQRLTGKDDHLAITADSMRAIGRTEQAIALAQKAYPTQRDPAERAELAIVLAGARADIGQFDAALAVLDGASRRIAEPELRERLAEARDRIEALSRGEEVEDVVEIPLEDGDELIEVFDLQEEDSSEEKLSGDDGAPGGEE
jgi:tetratricopeptide (TPR) repeat protein